MDANAEREYISRTNRFMKKAEGFLNHQHIMLNYLKIPANDQLEEICLTHKFWVHWEYVLQINHGSNTARFIIKNIEIIFD